MAGAELPTLVHERQIYIEADRPRFAISLVDEGALTRHRPEHFTTPTPLYDFAHHVLGAPAMTRHHYRPLYQRRRRHYHLI